MAAEGAPEWKFSQCFGEKQATEELTDGPCPLLPCLCPISSNTELQRMSYRPSSLTAREGFLRLGTRVVGW
jgi:hypothetical protein